MSCVRYATGHFACDEFDRFFIALDSAITAARVLCILGCVFYFLALVFGVVGASCTVFVSPSDKKQRFSRFAGLCNLVGGGLTGAGVSWYFARVLDQYFVYGTVGDLGNFGSTAFGGNERYIAGFCIYLGWVSMVLGILGGVLGCCISNESNVEEGYDEYADTYAPTTFGQEPSSSYNHQNNLPVPTAVTRVTRSNDNLHVLPYKSNSYENRAYVPPVNEQHAPQVISASPENTRRRVQSGEQVPNYRQRDTIPYNPSPTIRKTGPRQMYV